jgi:hypothetical protein
LTIFFFILEHIYYKICQYGYMTIVCIRGRSRRLGIGFAPSASKIEEERLSAVSDKLSAMSVSMTIVTLVEGVTW